MNFSDSAATLDTATDAELVAASVGGDRAAFGQIVTRYQRLLCSLAYSATGSMSESQDIAQEAFITAWRHLADLREPEKLRSWLCGILRHKVGRSRRSAAREPVSRADAIDEAGEFSAPDQPTADAAMNKEEQAILWTELARVPELYREPLILYYREHRSVEHVAAALDLTEDAVKQRLARGRKILQERVIAFVEGALARSTPGRVFTLGVLAALPAMVATPAKAAAVGAAVTQGSMMAKSTSIAALLASVSGFVNAVIALRASLDQTRTPRERRATVKSTIVCFFGSLAFIGVVYALRSAAFAWWEHRLALALVGQALLLGFIVLWPILIVRMLRFFRELRSAERRAHPECFRDPRDQVGSSASFYRSRATLCGVPLVHVRYSTPDAGEKPVFGWFAAGDRAYGLLVAWGAVTVAPISIGLVSVGIFSFGAVGFGVLSLGTCAVGFVAIGCMSVGWHASAWLSALGWKTAQSGGFALADTAARAPVAFAEHANNELATQFFAHPYEAEVQAIVLIVISLLSILPVAYYARGVRHRLGKVRSTT